MRTIGLSLLLVHHAPAQAPMTAMDSARHVLNRLAYGATPDQVDAVAHAGVMKWVDRQLGFSEPHDPALQDLEAHADVLHLSAADMDGMLQENQRRAREAQLEPDSTRRQQMVDAVQKEGQNGRRGVVQMNNQLAAITVARAVESDRQLDEILADFWTNHFNIFINKGQDRAYFADYLEHTIRAHALGKFEDLLVATAKSPAMLFYLDNAESIGDGSMQRLGSRGGALLSGGRFAPIAPRAGVYPPLRPDPVAMPVAPAAALNKAPRGLNENYARELMELHTLGVDGGYSQQDVIAVARILTGWSIDRKDGSFLFRAPVHDIRAKAVLGERFDAGHGQDEGLRLLHVLATSPATMHHVSAQLCARFVADVPPDGCIDDAVHAWKKSDGDIREVVRAIIASPDFWAPVNVLSKVKTPLEFVVSALRAVGAVPDSTPRMAQRVAQLGEPLFQHQTPDGYGERQEDWVNSGALLARMNFAVQLASGRTPGVTVDLDRIVPLNDDRPALVEAVNRTVLGGSMTAHTRDIILKELADLPDPRMARALAVGLAIGGPEFQKQ